MKGKEEACQMDGKDRLKEDEGLFGGEIKDRRRSSVRRR